MLDNADPVDAQQIDRQHQCAQHVIGYTRAGVAQDLGITGHQPEHLEGFYPRIDTRKDGEPLCGGWLQPCPLERGGVALVRSADVVEHDRSLSDRQREHLNAGYGEAVPPPVTLSRTGDVAVITIDDGKANALSFAVIDGLDDALTEAEASATAVALVGRDGKFSAGFDLAVMTAGGDDARRLLGLGAAVALRIFEFDVPVVLGVTGHALAMGGILTVAADYRVGAEGDYKIGLNEVAIGMPVPQFGVELCRDRLSPSWFIRCVQHATLCSPAEAVAAGFLDEVVPLDEVPTRAVAVATQLAETVNPGAFRMTRRTVRGERAEQLRIGLKADNLFDARS